MVNFIPAKVPLSKAQDPEKLEEYFLTSQCVVETFSYTDQWSITLICSFNTNLMRHYCYLLLTEWKPFFALADCLIIH